jgi:hypothetical protein
MTWKATMPKAISNTSPLLYLHRIDVLDWLPMLFSEIWVPVLSWASSMKAG